LDLPFKRPVEGLNPGRSLARHPLFRVVLAFQATTQADLDLPGLNVTLKPGDTATAKFALSLDLPAPRSPDGTPAATHAQIDYATDLFDRASVAALAGRLVRLLEAAAGDPDQAIGRLDILTPAERHTILHAWNDTAHPVPSATVPQLFEAQ